MRPPLLLVAAPLLASCGYRVVDPAVGGGRALSVPTAVNRTRWRGVEATLTSALRRDLQRRLDVTLDRAPADLVLRTEIHQTPEFAGIERGAPVRGEGGGAALGVATVEVRWRLESASGAELGSGTVRYALEFRPDVGEDAYSTIAEILDSVAELVVIEVGTRLDARAEDPSHG